MKTRQVETDRRTSLFESSKVQLGRVLCWGVIVSCIMAQAAAAERQESGSISSTRQAFFKLTFAHRDLIWLGDPVSPLATLYIQPDARPIAMDCYVRTLAEKHESTTRRYYREARVAVEEETRTVYAFTPEREKVIGTIDDQGRFAPNEFYSDNRQLLPTWPADASVLAYDPEENALYQQIAVPGPQFSETLDHLPLKLCDADGKPVTGRFRMIYKPSDRRENTAAVTLMFECGGRAISIAEGIVPRAVRRADVQLGSFDNKSGTYLPEAAYRAGAGNEKGVEPSVTVTFAGEFASSVKSDAECLTVTVAKPGDQAKAAQAQIVVDGNFGDWRNVAGVDDPRGDLVPYLEYVPDVDILEFKVAHDDEHIYLYTRVAGQVGRSYPDGGRSYFYAYMDVDQNPGTGFLPTRDDDCYFGVDIGDDCEVQFEFVNNAFRKTFYGFCGLGGDDEVLKQVVTIGKSQYGRVDSQGVEREHYKSEYTYRDGVTEITEDLKLGTSDTIRLAVSLDGSEVEVVSTLTGFLKNRDGRPTVALGQTIDVAAGMECDSKAYIGKTHWAADSTTAIRDYKLTPVNSRSDSTQQAGE